MFDIDEIKNYISLSPEDSAIYVGCDSHKTKKNDKNGVVFVVVVVIHKSCSRGAKVFYEKRYLPEFHSNKERLLKEVEMAADIGYKLIDAVGNRKFAIHLDLSNDPTNFSNCIVREAIGWIKGMGLTPVIKPDSVAANACADRFAK